MTFTTVIVRHGESAWNRRGLMQGQVDAPGLTTTGRAQAERVAAALAGCGAELVLTSDLRRARQTARVISSSLGISVLVEPRLRERNLGTAQGRPASADMLCTLGIIDGYVADPLCAPAGGETLREFHQRVSALLTELCQAHPDETVVLVTHGGVIRVARHCAEVGGLYAADAELEGMRWPEVDNGSVWSVAWQRAPQVPPVALSRRPAGSP